MATSIWTADYLAEGPTQITALQEAIKNEEFREGLRRHGWPMEVFIMEKNNTLRMRVNLPTNDDPFNPPWPDIFQQTLVGEPKVFTSQPALNLA